MNRTASAALAITASLALGACGGSAAHHDSTSPPTAVQIAQRIGATDLSPVDPPTLYAYTESTGIKDGRPVDIVTFRTDALRDSWVKVASQFGGVEEQGHLFVVADG